MTQQLTLGSLPLSARVLLTLFIMLIGFGYLSALGNLYQRHNMADGEAGLTIDDLRANFHGIEVAVEASAPDQPAVAGSRMLEMIRLGGEMREHVIKGGLPAVRALEVWLQRGATEAEFAQGGLAQPGDPAAAEVLIARCLDCHNADGGEKADVPFGPDLFTVDYRMVHEVARPGTAVLPSRTRPGGGSQERVLGPQALGHLFLVTHIHTLSIPVFTLIVSALFLFSSLPTGVRNLLGPVPMAALVCDFSCWWLARQSGVFVYVIAAAGGVYGVSFGFQLVAVFASMWLRRRHRIAA